jgi:2-polyprenyl-3-methyl-5-hydroxy-6-metoxy-1,4-benzoquinol methylase
VEPKPTPEMLSELYRDIYFQQSISATFQQEYSLEDLDLIRRDNDLALTIIESIRHGQEKKGTLLDVGCGEGFFLSSARARGFRVYGLDYSSYGIERYNPWMLDCFRQGDIFRSLADLSHEGKRFSVVNLSGILEHVIDPRALLDGLRGVLEKNGTIRVLVPNDDSKIQYLAERLGKASKFWVCPPQHLNYFNTVTLRSFLETRGFRVRRVLTDFPTDYFILNDFSNYVSDPAKGKQAHLVRQHVQRLFQDSDEDAYINLQEAQARCGVGRVIAAYATATACAKSE